MKKTQLLITALCASALLLGACNSKPKKKTSNNSQSSATSSQPEKVIIGIAVTNNPTKTSYAVGESFDPSGMVVTATYSDESTEVVTGQCTFSPSVMAESTTSVTVSYQGKTASVSVSKADWSAADVQVLETAAHGAKIPFPNEGTYTFALDSYGSAGDYFGGESSAEKIAAYKARFDTTVWEVTDFRSGVGFFAEVPVQTDDGKRYVQVICAGYDSTAEEITEDGSGQFFLEVSDPYYYSWADQDVGEELNYYFSYFASIGHASNYELELPAFTEIDHMSVMISDLAQYEYYAPMYFAYGMRYSPSPYAFEDEIDIYCSSTAAEAYLNALNDANSDFEYLGYDQDQGSYYFASKEGSLGLQVGYMVSYEVFYIVPFQNYTTAFPSEYLKGVLDRYQPSAPAFPAFAPSEDTVYYFEDFDNCYFVTCFQNGNMSEEDLTTYINGLDTSVFNVGEKQIEEGVGSYYEVSAKDGSYTFYASFYEETAEEYAYVEFQIYASLPTYDSLPVSYIDAYWAAENLVVPAAHEFAVASAEAYFELFEYKQGGFDIYVYGATSAELATFVAGFSTESWTVDADTESGSYQLICGDMSVAGNLVAVIEISDYSTDEEDPYIGLSYYVGVVPEQQAE